MAKVTREKKDIVAELDVMLANDLFERIKSGVASPAELREARAYLNDNKHLLSFAPEHPAQALADTLPDLSTLPEVVTH